ncbi:MAG: magnesium transporter CorA family protein [Patescibacteria group bacterium]
MIKYYKNTRQQPKLKQIPSYAQYAWIHVQNPSEKEVQELSKLLHITDEVLYDALDEHELPRLKYYGSNLVLIVRVPHSNNGNISTLPLTIILNDKAITTISTKKLDLFESIIKHKIPVITTQQSQFLIQVGLRIVEDYQKEIAVINKRVQREKKKFVTATQQEVLRMVSTEEILNDYIAALSPTIHVFKKLLHGNYIDIYDEDKVLIDDLLIDGEQVQQTSTTNLKTIRNIRDGYTTVLSIKQNQILKLLTYITAIFTLPMVIASVYGMNVSLPLQNNPFAFMIILSITVLSMIGAVIVFTFMRKRL